MGTTYTVAVLTIGDEICIGQIVNTNAAWLASKVATLGGDVTAHSSIGDNREQMLAELTRLQKSADAVLITGGLGPTHDDITKSVLCEYFNDTLVEDKGTIENLTDLFEKRGRILTERNRAQALRPSQSTALLNPRGTAPGLLFNQNGKLLVAMPGVPMEMKGIMTEHVLPLISETIAL
ncbi:MAG: competence/damage-inducible protein A, partial [Candidatus Kapabacteria bacterium]|nr:competence/damage-inducible protein A [Candidatus Kapabacteria bacterium]